LSSASSAPAARALDQQEKQKRFWARREKRDSLLPAKPSGCSAQSARTLSFNMPVFASANLNPLNFTEKSGHRTTAGRVLKTYGCQYERAIVL